LPALSGPLYLPQSPACPALPSSSYEEKTRERIFLEMGHWLAQESVKFLLVVEN